MDIPVCRSAYDNPARPRAATDLNNDGLQSISSIHTSEGWACKLFVIGRYARSSFPRCPVSLLAGSRRGKPKPVVSSAKRSGFCIAGRELRLLTRTPETSVKLCRCVAALILWDAGMQGSRTVSVFISDSDSGSPLQTHNIITEESLPPGCRFHGSPSSSRNRSPFVLLRTLCYIPASLSSLNDSILGADTTGNPPDPSIPNLLSRGRSRTKGLPERADSQSVSPSMAPLTIEFPGRIQHPFTPSKCTWYQFFSHEQVGLNQGHQQVVMERVRAR